MSSNEKLNRSLNSTDLDQFLICTLCDGYFRFAHTIAECGHTFCYDCLKVKMVTNCPTCQQPLNQSMVKKDPFKQNIVDLLYPDFSYHDKEVLSRMKQLLGDAIDESSITSLLQENNYLYHSRKKIKREKKKQQTDSIWFNTLIMEMIGVTLEEFKKDIQTPQGFQSLEQKSKLIKAKKHQEIQEQQMKLQQSIYLKQYQQQQQQQLQNKKIGEEEKQFSFIDLRPQTGDDFNILFLKCTMRIKINAKPKRLLMFKQYLFKLIDKNKCKGNGLIDEEMFNPDNIQLICQGNIIKEDEFVNLLQSSENPIQIVYKLLFKKSQ